MGSDCRDNSEEKGAAVSVPSPPTRRTARVSAGFLSASLSVASNINELLQSWWRGLPERFRVTCILTHHDAFVRATGTESAKRVRLMSLVFPKSTEMSKLLRVHLDSAPVLVEMREPAPHDVGATSSTTSNAAKLKVERVSVLELRPNVWEQWKRKSKAGTEVYIVKLPGGGGNPIAAPPPPHDQLQDDQKVVVISESLTEIFQKLWTTRPKLQSEEEYHRKPLEKWLELTKLNRKEDDCEECYDLEKDVGGSSSKLRVDVFFLEYGKHVGRLRKLLNSSSGAIAIWPSLVLDLVFENTLSNARHQLSTIKASLRALLEKPSSRWGNEKLTLSCACSSSPSAVSVRQQHSGSRLLPSGTSFQVKKRGLNNQVKFEAEVDDPSLSSSADHVHSARHGHGQQEQQLLLEMEVHATWDVLFHSPSPFRYEFSISQTGMGTTPKPKEHSWCQAVNIYH